MCIRTWFFRVMLCVNLFPHFLHRNLFSPEWVKKCFFRFTAWVKIIEHWLQQNCFISVWISLCLFSSSFTKKYFPHWSQKNDFTFSSLWILFQWSLRPSSREKSLQQQLLQHYFCGISWDILCVFRIHWCLKALSHRSQKNSIWAPWIIWCVFRPLLCWNDLSQRWQGKDRSPVCTFWCDIKPPFSKKAFWQCLQEKCFSPPLWTFWWFLKLG